jgi:uncharacterized damage-inducible protein DinB
MIDALTSIHEFEKTSDDDSLFEALEQMIHISEAKKLYTSQVISKAVDLCL